MLARGLKTNVVITLAALLLTAMLLTDLVVSMQAQQDLIQAEGEKGFLLLSNLEAARQSGADEAESAKAHFLASSARAGFDCALRISSDGRPAAGAPEACTYGPEIEALVRLSMASGRRQIQPAGATWGVFWKQPQALLIASPLVRKDRIIGAAGLVRPLKGVYRSLRQSQQILLFYVLLNLIILTGIGLHRLSKLYLQPIRRLVNRAEAYREDDAEILFSVRKGDNELRKLSSALNRMIKRIAADKEKLRATVASLEKANLDLKQAQSEIILAEKLAAVGRLSAGIAHEIGNPIGIVIGYLDLLKRPDTSAADRNDFLLRTENEVNRIHTIIRQLLDLARPAPKISRTVAVHGLIADMAQILKVQPLMSKVQLDLRLAADKDVIQANPDQIRQVFLNLAINAADALNAMENKSDGRLSILTELLPASAPGALQLQETLKVVFADNGPGIPAENLGNIFDPFFTTKAPGKGTGLGLSVSFMIVEGVGGTIKADSRAGQGTRLAVYLPLCESDE